MCCFHQRKSRSGEGFVDIIDDVKKEGSWPAKEVEISLSKGRVPYRYRPRGDRYRHKVPEHTS